MTEERKFLHIFLCYRQVDGSSIARWLYQHLNESRVSDIPFSPILEIYFDQGAPATGDWIAVHGPSLEQSKALLFVCTPGAFTRISKNDWVHAELDWWISHRSTPPIIVDVTGEGERWIPESIKLKWPNCQRVLCQPENWKPAEALANAERIKQQIVNGIRLSESGVLFEELEKQRGLLRQSKRFIFATLVAGLLACAAFLSTLKINQQLIDSNEKIASVNILIDSFRLDLDRTSAEIYLAHANATNASLKIESLLHQAKDLWNIAENIQIKSARESERLESLFNIAESIQIKSTRESERLESLFNIVQMTIDLYRKNFESLQYIRPPALGPNSRKESE